MTDCLIPMLSIAGAVIFVIGLVLAMYYWAKAERERPYKDSCSGETYY